MGFKIPYPATISAIITRNNHKRRVEYLVPIPVRITVKKKGIYTSDSENRHISVPKVYTGTLGRFS